MLKIRLASPIEKDSIVDGEGLRVVLWLQGCVHFCSGCHNPETHDINGGKVYDVNEIIAEIKNHDFFDGITFSGGEPILQPEAVLEIAKTFQSVNKWLYTGYTYEQLLVMSNKNEILSELLNHLDVIVDGKFDQNLKSLNLKFRGSSNQRIIDVKKSLKKKQIVLKKIDEKVKKNDKQVIYI